jgi:uncharacterized membrane protein
VALALTVQDDFTVGHTYHLLAIHALLKLCLGALTAVVATAVIAREAVAHSIEAFPAMSLGRVLAHIVTALLAGEFGDLH